MPGIDNKIFFQHSEVPEGHATLIRASKHNKCQKLIKQNDILLENARFCASCRLIAATIRPAHAYRPDTGVIS